jgi:HD superfamily phosphohydrolase
MNKDNSNELNYYLKPVKFVRDLVHGYVYLTEFDLKIIDTDEFQRLKDVCQLTSQSVYPAARHTRFDHSLGVLELTRQAIKNINRNGILEEIDNGERDTATYSKEFLSDQLQFNAALAALLHDVGHCPFSHLGETQFDKHEVWNEFFEVCNSHKSDQTFSKEFIDEITKMNNEEVQRAGARHEQLSCIVILKKYYHLLKEIERKNVQTAEATESPLYVDFELIVRSIIGMNYDIRESSKREENKIKNVVVGLINSSIFDMDKLDYLMRDAYLTGIGTPRIDTHRLFRNMYLCDSGEYNLVFTQRAIPSLQNMISSRDELYMYVYNHHAAVLSDFMMTYIFRRLDHNVQTCEELILKKSKSTIKIKAKIKIKMYCIES